MKYLSIIKYVFLAISALSFVPYLIMGEDGVNYMLNWAYLLLLLTVVVTIVLPLINLVKNPKGAKSSLIGIVIVGLVAAFSYFFASDAPVPNPAGGFFDDPTLLKITDMELYATYAAVGAIIVLVVLGEIRNAFK